METYYTIYKTTNKINGRTYIGCHQTTDLMDGYMGSGKLLRRAIKKYGIDNFEKEILEIFDNPEHMFTCESDMVDEAYVDSPTTYNLKEGGSGGWNRFNRNSEIQRSKNKRSQLKQRAMERDPKWVECRRAAQSDAQTKSYINGRTPCVPDWTGKTHSIKTKMKIGKANSKHQTGSGNSQYGTRWIFNAKLKESKKIKNTDAIPTGWRLGRK